MIPTDRLRSGDVCYCAGSGEDISLDLELARRFGCEVYSIDPTPRAQQYVARAAAGVHNLHPVPLGLWSSTKRMRFYAPRNKSHVSHSVVNIQRTKEYFEADCVTLRDLMKRLGHEEIALLKMDIEGAEYEVIDDMLATDVRAGVLCVEFDQPSPIHQTIDTVRRLRETGYELVKVDTFNFTFLRH